VVTIDVTVPFNTTTLTPTQWGITYPFPSTAAIPTSHWYVDKVLGGAAAKATNCNRNYLTGDTAIINGDCIFNPVTNKYELPTWPVSPAGLGTDANGPSHAAYDVATDSVYLIRDVTTASRIPILHCATNTWEIVDFANTPEVVHQAFCFRSQIRIANGNLYAMSQRGSGFQCLIRYEIATKTFFGYPVPQTPVPYNSPDSTAEPQLVYDPVSNVLLHPWAFDLTGDTTLLYVFSLATHQWLPTRPVPTFAPAGSGLNVRNGYATWDPPSASMMIWGRIVTGLPGYSCWHYKYAP
jgi:hypothetical protein